VPLQVWEGEVIRSIFTVAAQRIYSASLALVATYTSFPQCPCLVGPPLIFSALICVTRWLQLHDINMERKTIMTTLHSARAVSKRLGICRLTLYRYVRDGLLEGIYVGPKRMLRISEEALQQFLERNRSVAADFKQLAANDHN